MDITALIDSLHPLEIKVLAALKDEQATAPSGSLREDELAQQTSLEASQVSMALGWLLAKSLISIRQETNTPFVSLTKVGERYFEKYSPVERILSALQDAGQTGKRLTIQDIQSREGLEPSEMSGAVGSLKKEGAIRIVSGGCVEATGTPSHTAKALRTLLNQLHGTKRELTAIAEPLRRVVEQHAVKRGNANEPFRIDDHIDRWYVLTPEGDHAADLLAKQGPLEEVSQLTPELLKDGSWRSKRFRKYTISLRPPRALAGKRHPYREFLDLVKLKLVSMGFEEMRGSLVENEFWNMDALYMPQFHPARAIHDVYFVKEPTHAREIAEPF
ncbi:MAG: hypothetical protein FJ246_08050, partial [Nitrospira sp.]|nr:hypothetical protein [Nitrospira sp.]